MKNRLFKIIAAAGTALIMAVTGMVMTASAAQSWSVRFYPAQAPNGIQYTDINIFANSTSTSYFYDSCPNYTQSYNIYGVPQ